MELAAAFLKLTRAFPEPHVLVTPVGDILAANPAAARALGISPANPAASLPALVAGPPEPILAYLRACSATSSFVPGALSLRSHKGEPKRFRCEAAALRPDAANEPLHVVLRLRPVEEASRRFLLLNERIRSLNKEIHLRQQVEDELQAQALQLEETAAELESTIEELEDQRQVAEHANHAKSQFLAVMSHELRTPLNAIVGYADILDAEVDGDLTENQKGRLTRIRRAAEHLSAIIAQILNFSRIEAGREEVHVEEVDLVPLAREVADLLGPTIAADLEIVLDLPVTEMKVETDAAKVRQILLNLLSNAAKFTTDGQVRLLARDGDDGVRIAVADTGVGIAPEDLERIFEPFFQVQQGSTRAAGGTGLGLTVTRGLARLLGGDIRVESTPGQGSTFTLRLPRSLAGG